MLNTIIGCVSAVSIAMCAVSGFGEISIKNYLEESVPVVVFDTDFSSDCDDALALQLLIQADKDGEIDLAAVCLSMDCGEEQIQAVEGLLDYNQLYDVPIGVSSTETNGDACYYDELIQYKTSDHQTLPADELYITLAEEYSSYNIVLTGHLTNLEDVLQGKEKNVFLECLETVYIQGGAEDGTGDNNYSLNEEMQNATMYVDDYFGEAIDVVIVPYTVSSDFVVGITVQDLMPNHPISQVLNAYHGLWSGMFPTKGRVAWDPTCAYIALNMITGQDTELFEVYDIYFEENEDTSLTWFETGLARNIKQPNARAVRVTNSDKLLWMSEIDNYLIGHCLTVQEIYNRYANTQIVPEL